LQIVVSSILVLPSAATWKVQPSLFMVSSWHPFLSKWAVKVVEAVQYVADSAAV